MKFIKQSIFVFSIIFFLLSIMNINVEAISDSVNLDISNGEIEKNTKDYTIPKLLNKYKAVISFCSGISSFCFFILSLVQIIKLSKYSLNLKAKKKHIVFLILFIILLMIFGSISLTQNVYY